MLFRSEMIRATYGHSIEIELDLPTDDIPEALYWPCEPTEADAIVQLGITSGTRNHIHLSKTIVNALEAGHVRISRPTIIEVDTVRAVADGHTIYRAGNIHAIRTYSALLRSRQSKRRSGWTSIR